MEDRLAAAAREKLAQASKESKEKQLQAERKRKAALFLQTLKNPLPEAEVGKVEESPFSVEVSLKRIHISALSQAPLLEVPTCESCSLSALELHEGCGQPLCLSPMGWSACPGRPWRDHGVQYQIWQQSEACTFLGLPVCVTVMLHYTVVSKVCKHICLKDKYIP